jgi:hypothetical protein
VDVGWMTGHHTRHLSKRTEEDMAKIAVKPNHMTYNGMRYFTANAQTVSIGSYGEKATPVFGQNKLEVKGHFPAPGLKGKIRTAPPIELDTTNSTKADFTSTFSAIFHAIGFSGSVGVIYDNLVNSHLKLVELWVEENDMRSWINGAPKHRTNLANDGSDARVAHRVFVVMEASYADSFTSGANFEVTADAAGIFSINASGGGVVSGKSKLTLGPGTVWSYLLLKVDWNSDRTWVEDTDVDEWSVN